MKYTQQDIQKIASLYKSGMSAMQIADTTPYSHSSVSKYIKELGLTRNKRDSSTLNECKQKIKDLYLSGMYSKDIAAYLNLSESKVAYHVHNMGIARPRGRKSQIGLEDYFDTIDKPRKAYWLGWLMGDGNVSVYRGQYAIKLKTQCRDSYLITQFLSDINAETYKVVTVDCVTPQGKPDKAKYVSLSSKHMVLTLMKYGIIPRKTGFEKIPENIDQCYIPHFLRGFYDAEGHVSYSKRYKHKYYDVGFTTNENMCQQIMSAVGIHTSINKKVGVSQIHFGRKQGRTLFNFLYNDADFYLVRKHDSFLEMLNN